MQATVIDSQIEQEIEPQIRLWSIADYHQMIEAKILDEGDRVELLEGKIVCMGPQRPFHAASVQRSSRLLIYKSDKFMFFASQKKVFIAKNLF
jgi:hypothetical protein